MSDLTIPIDQSDPGINLSRCEFRCMIRLVLRNVILEANTLKNLLSNVPHLQYLELYKCVLKGHEIITLQSPKLLWLHLFGKKSGGQAIIVAPNLQVKSGFSTLDTLIWFILAMK